MRIRLAIPEQDLTDAERKPALDAALEAVTRTIVPLVQRRKVPTAAAAIRAGLRWKPEPPGDEHFDLPQTTIARGWGDCDDLAPHHAASLRATGVDKGARAVVKKSGPNRWHAVVRRSDGSIEDPSKAAGMGSGVSGLGGYVGGPGAIVRPMHADRLCCAVYPVPGIGALARVDIPDQDLEWSWSGSHLSRDPLHAIRGAIQTARAVANEGSIGEDENLRLAAVEDLLAGHALGDILEALDDQLDGDEEYSNDIALDAAKVGSFFGSIAKVFRPIAKRIAPVAKFNPFNVARKVAKGDNLLKSVASINPLTQAGYNVARGGNVLSNALSTIPIGRLRALVQANPELAPYASALTDAGVNVVSPFITPWGANALRAAAGNYVRTGNVKQSFHAGLDTVNPLKLARSYGRQQAQQFNVPNIVGMAPGVPYAPEEDGPIYIRF